MRRPIAILLVALLSWATAAVAGPQDAQYVVGAGDVLQLNVPQVPSLDRQITVRPDGMIVLPMAGEMRAGGQTIEQLQYQIARRLSDFNRNVTSVSVIGDSGTREGISVIAMGVSTVLNAAALADARSGPVPYEAWVRSSMCSPVSSRNALRLIESLAPTPGVAGPVSRV